jgi:predicted dehydrogenase
MRAAVIGLGVGKSHIKGYQALQGVEVAAIADVSEAALESAAEQFGIDSTYTDYAELLARPDIDVVSTCTPDALHAEQALAALGAGKHVLCEKPMTTRLADAAEIVAKVRETGLAFMMCHNYRFTPQFARLKELTETGVLGDVYYADSSYVQDLYSMEALGPDYWRFKDPQDFYLGGAVHNVDLLRWVIGEVEEVHAFSNHMMPFYPIDENYVSSFRFANGCIGRVLLILGSQLKDQFFVDLNVYGYRGALKTTMQSPQVVQNLGALEGSEVVVETCPSANSHMQAVAHFVDSVRRGKRPSIDEVDGAKSVAVCLAAIQSSSEGRPVTVDYGFL